MKPTNFVLVDHQKEWSTLRPLSITKPVSFIRVGILKIYEKWELYLNAPVLIKTVEKYLSSFDTFKENENAIYINSSVLPNEVLAQEICKLKEGESLYKDGILIASNKGKAVFETVVKYSGPLHQIKHPWDIFQINNEEIESDFKKITFDRKSEKISDSNIVLNQENNIFIEKGAKVEASTLNPNGGFIYVAKNAEIMEGSAIRGSLAMCEGSVLKLNTKIYGATTIGPYSKVGGEVNNSVIQGYSNKGHDGFLGNSVIGEWCNLGADTNNSNLKNNYGEVKSWSYDKEKFVSSGLQFLGLVMGDHTKCGINTMFNTGTVTGVFANIFGSDFPPRYIPSFVWGGSSGFETYQLEKALEVAKVVMKRRNVELTEEHKKMLEYIFNNK